MIDDETLGDRGRLTMQAVRGDGSARAAEVVAGHVIDVPDFPQDGIVFKDLGPLFADGPAFREVIDAVAGSYRAGGAASATSGGAASATSGGAASASDGGADPGFDVVAGIEARGFLLAAALAYATGTGVVPVRKAGKLPRETHSASYALEYGTATLEVQTDAFLAGQRVLVFDDVLATGGTAEASMSLVERGGGRVVGFVVLLELAFLGARERLAGRPVHAVLTV
jgi:adenine phosphoribosyltransferase